MPSKAVLPWVWICFSILCYKIRNPLFVFVFWQHSSHLSAALTVSSNLPLPLYQLCTILYIIEWCLRFLFLLQHKVINKGMISPCLQASLHPSSFCLGLASSPSGTEASSCIFTKDLSASLKSYQISECVFDSTIRPSVHAFCSVWLIYWAFLFIYSRGIRLWPKVVY